MPYAAALSEHPLAAHAVGEAAGDVLDRLGADADLAAVFVTPPHLGALEDIVAAVRRCPAPVCCSARPPVRRRWRARSRTTPALSCGPGHAWPTPWRVAPAPPDHRRLGGGGAGRRGGATGLDADGPARPFSFPVGPFLDDLRERYPGLSVVGGMASAARTGREPPRARRSGPRRRSGGRPARRSRAPPRWCRRAAGRSASPSS